MPMNGLRGAILSLFGLTVAIAAALVVLPIACLLDPVTRQAGAAFAHFAFFSLADSTSPICLPLPPLNWRVSSGRPLSRSASFRWR